MTPTRNELAEQRAEHLPGADRKLYEAFRDLGMSPAAALVATQGRDPYLPSTDRFEALTESFEQSGMSTSAARVAAVGRHSTEREVREALSGSNSSDIEPSDLSPLLTREEKEFRDSLTTKERDDLSEAARQVVEEHQLGRTYGSDAFAVAGRFLLKAAHRRMKEGS